MIAGMVGDLASISAGPRARPDSLPRHRAFAPNLQNQFNPRRNHLSSIRLVLSVTVVLAHAMDLGFSHQPTIAGTQVGDLAVDAFFVLSGFLLTGSYLRLGSIRRYVWHRFLRIMPGFWVCLLVTALLVAPAIAWMQGRSPGSVFTGERSAFDFLIADSMLLMREFGISGLPLNVPAEGVMNGSLWTLFYEAICYLTVIGLGIIGALRRWPRLTLAVVVLLWSVTVINASGFQIVTQERLLRFTLMFLIGAVMFLYARQVPIQGRLAVLSLLVLGMSLVLLPDYRALAAPAFAYLCLWFAVVYPPKKVPVSDYSYGIYVYHWPVLQLLVVAGASELGEPWYIAIGLALALGAAFVSWRLVERPCLRFKDAAWVTG